MSKQWKFTAVGFCIGICVMLIFNFFTNSKEENRMVDSQEDVSNLEDEYIESAKNENAEMGSNEIGETEHKELESSGIRISDNVEVSHNFVEELLLYQYIEYGIRKYNENSGDEKQYYVDLKDMLPYDTEFCMQNDDSEPFKTDLAKEIIPELSNNLYNLELIGEDGSIYMQIDTYNMKIYIYDGRMRQK